MKTFKAGDRVHIANSTGAGHPNTGTVVMVESGDRSRSHAGVTMYRVTFDNGPQGLYAEHEMEIAMNDFTIINDYNDACPVHGSEEKREYDFGMMDATVITFQGCKCAMSHTDADIADMVYHTSYNSAAGRACLRKAQNALPL